MDIKQLVGLIDKAAKAYSEGDLLRALHLYDEAIIIDPSNNVLYSNRSAILFRLDRFAEALQEAECSIGINPNFAKAHMRKGDSLKGLLRIDEALFTYCKALTLDPSSQQLLNALTQCITISQFKDSSLSTIRSVLKDPIEENTFSIISMVGQAYLTSGLYSEAIAILKCAEEMNCQNVELKISLFGAISKAYYHQGNNLESIKYLEEKLKIAQQHGMIELCRTIHEQIATIALLMDTVMLAVEHFAKAIEMHHENTKRNETLCKTLSDLLTQIGDFTRAIEILESPHVSQINRLFGLIKIAIAKNDVKEAIEYCHEILEISTDINERSFATAMKCKCLLMLKDVSSAMKILKATVNGFSNEEPLPQMIGLFFGILSECHIALGQYCYARKWVRKQLKIAITANLSDLEAEALRNLSNIYEQIDDYKNSIALWKKFCQLNESNSIDVRIKSLQHLAKLYEKSNEYDNQEAILVQRLDLAKRTALGPFLIEAHSNLVQFYRKHKRTEKRLIHFNEEKRIFEDISGLNKQSFILLDEADYHLDQERYKEAVDAYEYCLMLIQEEGNLSREGEICWKLADAHYALMHYDEALLYYEQSLSVYQQIPDIRSIMQIYSAIGKIHSRKGSLKESYLCYKYYHTLASFLADKKAKLDAIINIVRLLLDREEYRKAKKIIPKALNLAEEEGARRETGLLYGYLAQSFVGLGNKNKALENFCKQLPYFDEIDDTEGKCETLKHLIEEKLLRNDISWALKLCQTRIEVSSEASTELQLTVLNESALTASKLFHNVESCRFLEKALSLSIKYGDPNSKDILLNLLTEYRKCGNLKKAVNLLTEYIHSFSNHPSKCVLLFEVGKFQFLADNVRLAIKSFNEALSVAKDPRVKADCNYALASCNFKLKNYEKSMEYLQKCKNDYEYDEKCTKIGQKLDRDLALLHWYCADSDQYVDVITKIIYSGKAVHDILDQCCFYDLLNQEDLSQIVLLHWLMANGDFDNAYKLINNIVYDEIDRIIIATDRAFLLFLNEKNAECISHITEFLQMIDGENRICEDIELFAKSIRDKNLLNLLGYILAICIIKHSGDLFSSLAIAECSLWRNFLSKGLSGSFPKEHLNNITDNIHNYLKPEMLYYFNLDQFTLIWHTNKNSECNVYYRYEMKQTQELPLFYSCLLRKLFNSSNLKSLKREELDKILMDSSVLININEYNLRYTYATWLCQFKEDNTMRQLPDISLLVVAPFDEQIKKINYVTTTDHFHILKKIQVASVIVIDLSQTYFDATVLLNYKCIADIAILIGDETSKMAKFFVFAGITCVIDIKSTENPNIEALLEKLLDGVEVKNAISELADDKIRIFGKRNITVRQSKTSELRKNMISIYGKSDCSVHINEALKSVNELKELPSILRERYLQLIKRENTREILSLFELLEDLKELPTNKDDHFECIKYPELEKCFIEMNPDEQRVAITLLVRIFHDHLYGSSEILSQSLSIEETNELLKSLTIKEREARKRKRRRKIIKEFWSEGEGSRRSSISEINTETEAAVIDVEFSDY